MIVPGQLADCVAEPAVSSIDERTAEHCPALQSDWLGNEVSGARLDQIDRWRSRRRLEGAVDVDDTNFLVLRAQPIIRAIAERVVVDSSINSHLDLPRSIPDSAANFA
ncbi:hypothetical protein ACVOMS_25530 [Bradyrhizobium guangxiense]